MGSGSACRLGPLGAASSSSSSSSSALGGGHGGACDVVVVVVVVEGWCVVRWCGGVNRCGYNAGVY